MQNFGTSPANSLSEELIAGKELLQLLQQEQDLLINANIDGLAKVTEEKAKVVARMTDLAQRRHRLLADAGFEASEAGMQAWLKKPGTAEAGASWNALLDLARQAKELNRTNGMLIGQHMARGQNALNALQGGPKGGNLYGPSGQTTTGGVSRTLIVG